MTRIPYETMKNEIVNVLRVHGFTAERAEECALLFAEASLEGVYSHGLNRVPRFINYIQNGWVDVHAVPSIIDRIAVIERYDGNKGPGNLNAKFAMDRAVEIAHEHGIGLVTLKNTNHWMRGGSYGWQAARAGCIGICWTNTESCMPPWGAKDIKIGNNPLVLAVPGNPDPVVLDMAMSQFSYGKLQTTRLNKEQLPVQGGYDQAGRLTTDPAAIEATKRILPTGFWKGSGLAVLLDLTAAMISGGLTTYQIDSVQPAPEVSCYLSSQVFVAIDPQKISGNPLDENLIRETVAYLHGAEPVESGGKVTFPGERTMQTRAHNLEHGIPVDDGIWEQVLSLK